MSVDASKLDIGVKVLYHDIVGDAGEKRTCRSKAWQLGHGDWVVSFEGYSGGYDVEHISKILE
jgi:hypothetical protein